MSNGPQSPGWKRALALANLAARCGARRKVGRAACRSPAIPNGRCWVHGGASTGLARQRGWIAADRLDSKHGHHSGAA